MTDTKKHDSDATQPTDADIASILATQEPGVAELLAAYDIAEQQYFSAATVSSSFAIVDGANATAV